jgi:hypothetical protein
VAFYIISWETHFVVPSPLAPTKFRSASEILQTGRGYCGWLSLPLFGVILSSCRAEQCRLASERLGNEDNERFTEKGMRTRQD